MLRLLDRVTDTSFISAVALNGQRDKPLAGPYREIRDFRAPDHEYDILEGNRRGVVFASAEGNLYFVDAVRWHSEKTGKWEFEIREHGFKILSGLPKEYPNFKHNPNEWEELRGLFVGEAPEEVKQDLLVLLKFPPLWTARNALQNSLQ